MKKNFWLAGVAVMMALAGCQPDQGSTPSGSDVVTGGEEQAPPAPPPAAATEEEAPRPAPILTNRAKPLPQPLTNAVDTATNDWDALPADPDLEGDPDAPVDPDPADEPGLVPDDDLSVPELDTETEIEPANPEEPSPDESQPEPQP